MSQYFRDRYRIPSIRLPNRDYSEPGSYFITICTHRRLYYFGNVTHGKMVLSPIGQIAHDFWQAIPDHHPHVQPDTFVIMPDHMHGIITIGQRKQALPSASQIAQPQDAAPDHPPGNRFGGQPSGSLQTIIQSYKSAVTRWCRKQGYDTFAWQPRYYEHIVRNDGSIDRIRQYINNNPRKWRNKPGNNPHLWM